MCRAGWAIAIVEAGRLRELALLRRVRDRIDRDHAQPLDIEALARTVGMSAGHLSREFRRAYGESPSDYLASRRRVHLGSCYAWGRPTATRLSPATALGEPG